MIITLGVTFPLRLYFTLPHTENVTDMTMIFYASKQSVDLIKPRKALVEHKHIFYVYFLNFVA